MESIRKGESITTGVVIKKNVGCVCTTVDQLVAENVPFSLIYTINQGKFGIMDVDWLACSATICHYPEKRFLALSQKSGEVLRIGGGETATENFSYCREGFKRKPGIMREIRGVGKGCAYAVGTGRQAYRREGNGIWKSIDEWSQMDSKELVKFSFESIDGFNEEDIYVVGWEGEIWHYNGKKFRKIDSPTSLSLHRVKCADDGKVYISGKNGILLRGREDKWELIEHNKIKDDIWGIEWFYGTIYVSTTYMIYQLKGDELETIDYKDGDIPGTCYHLSAVDEVMWSIGPNDIIEFDGRKWLRIV